MTNITSEICTGRKVTKDGLSAHQQTQAEKNHFALRSCLWTQRGHPSEIREGCTFHTESAERTELRSVVLARWHCPYNWASARGSAEDEPCESHVMPRLVGMTSHGDWRVCVLARRPESRIHTGGMACGQTLVWQTVKTERENNDRWIHCAPLERACSHPDHIGWKWKQLLTTHILWGGDL